ncbi:hypothetical protein M9H77_29608 [Catharanthus roseus]|uniref:Uncharacterized protein n=1 Tax=Catharanthus roseus TaxID=4058 RepID=A0ACB9ZV96_CATRO|nr:hypothetical protein M9H77_29608 [Catharanthus roseus]
MMEHVTVIIQMVSHEPSMLYTTVNEDDDEIDYSDEYYVTSSQSKSDDNNDAEEEDIPYMGSGSPIVDLVESGTLRLLDWNDSMTDIQLGMRFVDKVQAISAVWKWSIRVGREYRVVKSKNDT